MPTSEPSCASGLENKSSHVQAADFEQLGGSSGSNLCAAMGAKRDDALRVLTASRTEGGGLLSRDCDRSAEGVRSRHRDDRADRPTLPALQFLRRRRSPYEIDDPGDEQQQKQDDQQASVERRLFDGCPDVAAVPADSPILNFVGPGPFFRSGMEQFPAGKAPISPRFQNLLK